MMDYRSENVASWPPLKKLAVAFIMAYLLLYILPFPLDQLLGESGIYKFITDVTDAPILWIGRHLLGMKDLHRIEFTGSGDTTFNYVQLLWYAVLALLAAVIFVSLRRREANYNKQLSWVQMYARYYLGLIMIFYGMAKLYEGQFPFPGLATLDESYGDSSPMGLLWTFMGYSKSYTVFSGIGEITGGLLLLFRRTTYAGCLVTVGIMLNVAMLNFSYDVPVKLFSCHLVLIALFVLFPAIKKIFGFFFLQKETSLAVSKLILPKRWMRISRIAIKCLLIICLPVAAVSEALDSGGGEEHAATLSGIYKTEEFSRNGVVLPPASSDTFRWKSMILDRHYAKITTMPDSTTYFGAKADTTVGKLVLTSFDDSTVRYSFAYSAGTSNHFSVFGVYKGDSLRMLFTRKRMADYRLVNRGFHWINEYPYNR